MKAYLKNIVHDRLYFSENLRVHRLAQRIIIFQQNVRLGRFGYRKIVTNKLNIKLDNDIPRMSWACIVDGKGYSFRVGNLVEASSSRVIEGAWDGDFTKSKIEETEFIYGSGATVRNKEVIFVPPKHGLESLFVLFDKTKKCHYVSNSLGFVLSEAGLSVETSFFKHLSDTIHERSKKASEVGIDKYERVLAEDNNMILRVMTYYNFSVANDGSMKIHFMPAKQYFSSYQEYHKFLSSLTRRVFSNAQSKDRQTKFKPVSTVSKGYDSTAVSAIAKENGSTTALTLDVTVYGYNDSGKSVGEKLGLKVLGFQHVLSGSIKELNINFKDKIKNQALEFIATDGIGDDVAFLPFEKKLKNKIYMSGTYGDVLWKLANRLSPGFTKLVFEKSMSEFRLRVGFVNFPLISAGARFPGPIRKISTSTVMTNFSVGGKYDRPIPRRIAEEAGVPRDYFGVQKSASSPLILNHKDLFPEAMTSIMKRYHR